ncbi:MAG: hypothetical protein IPI57_07275 [Candidatus Competibacteraceae bacterium]|nr:hypothetical protein [Candidatus Competibacteraceae bacterium]
MRALVRLAAGYPIAPTLLAFCKDGVNRLVLGKALELDAQRLDAFCERLLQLGLAEDRGYGHLRLDIALSHYINSRLPANQRPLWRERRWCAGMEQLLEVLYQQSFKQRPHHARLLRLELPNPAGTAARYQQHAKPEQTAHLDTRLEQFARHPRRRPPPWMKRWPPAGCASQALSGWSRIRFETERLRIRRLRDGGSIRRGPPSRAARKLLRQCQTAGDRSYAGRVTIWRAPLQLGKLLQAGRRRRTRRARVDRTRGLLRGLADAGNASAGRMVAVADAEIGDCLIYLQRLRSRHRLHEAAIARAGSSTANLALAANKMQLGLVRQRQGRYPGDHAGTIPPEPSSKRWANRKGPPAPGVRSAWLTN